MHANGMVVYSSRQNSEMTSPSRQQVIGWKQAKRRFLMKQSHTTWLCSGIFTATLLHLSLTPVLNVSKAYSEMYIGGQIGTTLLGDNNKLTRVDLTDFGGPPGSTLSPPGSISGRDLATSVVLGGKIGYYFPQAQWFGLELETFYSTPHIEQQPTRFSILPGTVVNGSNSPPSPGGSVTDVFPGDNFRVITVAPFNLMFRYHKTRFQPYVGVGPGIFLARIKTTQSGFEGTQSSTRVGLNVKVGGEYFFTKHISGFGEVRYNYTTLNFDANEAGGFGFKAIYNPVIFSFGVNYHF
jgi:opacity protein-like surface antigen